MKILLLGGNGFIGSAIVRALSTRAVDIIIASRRPRPNQIELHMQKMLQVDQWAALIEPYDMVINAVGILRPRLFESYDNVHAMAPTALAEACEETGTRLIHISALDLQSTAKSEFILSKIKGEKGILAAKANATIIRPSLLDGEGGFGAKWLRLMAKLPIYFTFRGLGKIAPLQVNDLGEAISNLCLNPKLANGQQILEFGGNDNLTLPEYMVALVSTKIQSKLIIEIPKWLVGIVSVLCDCLYVTPLSFGHFELLQGENVPIENSLPRLLGRCPSGFGENEVVNSTIAISDAKGQS